LLSGGFGGLALSICIFPGHHLCLANGFGGTGSFRGAQNLYVLLCFGIIVGTAAFCIHCVLHPLASLLACLSP
jgi:hypothetical protein